MLIEESPMVQIRHQIRTSYFAEMSSTELSQIVIYSFLSVVIAVFFIIFDLDATTTTKLNVSLTSVI